MPPFQNTPNLGNIQNQLGGTISSESLSGTNVNIPTFPLPQNNPQQVQMPNADSILADSRVADTQNQTDFERLVRDVTGATGLLGGESDALTKERERLGVNTLRTQYQGIINQGLKLNASLQQDDVALAAGLNQIEDKPIAMEFITGEQASVERRAHIARAFKVAEINTLNAQATALGGNINMALTMAREAVDAKYAPIKEFIDIKQKQLEAIAPLVSKDEAKQLKAQQLKIDLSLKDLDERKANEKEAKNIALTLAQNQAPAELLNLALGAKSVEDMLKIPGVEKYLVSPMEKLQMQKINLDIRNSNQEYANLVAEANKAKQYLQGTTGDPILDIISASAQYGDKRLTDSQLEKIQQATNALGSLESLQGLLKIDSTGPLSGRGRTLVSQLGGDADARAINATIQGLIPTVARGIFGEVGVLTDADINNYRKTIPNLTSTEGQNKLVSLVMYDVLSRSVKTTLTSNAQNQANVSNFASTYLDIEKRISTLKKDIGATEGVAISEQNRTKLESAWGNSSFGINNVSNQLNSFLENN